MATEMIVHPILQTPINMPAQDGLQELFLAAGCFWGVERIFWQTPGVVTTAVGYMGGEGEHPTYVQVCTGTTGHAEAVRVVYDPALVEAAELLAIYFENHDPTQVNRQGNDRGTQYRSAVWTTTSEQYETASQVKGAYERKLQAAGFRPIATQIHQPPPPVFYFAEDYHQAYLHWNPAGYCNHGFNGFACPRPA